MLSGLWFIFLFKTRREKDPDFKEISRKIDSPEQFTAKILQNLARAELISSMKGRGGGFFFDQTANPLTIYDVIRVMEGDKFFSKCGFGLRRCDGESPCPLHEDYSPLREGFFKLVKEEQFSRLAKKINEQKAVLTR